MKAAEKPEVPLPPVLNCGQKYWTVAAWTGKGIRPEECRWDNNPIDFKRRRNRIIFSSKKVADQYLLNNKEA